VPEGAAPTAPARGRVMIVESSQTDQETLRDFFTKLGCRVLLTENPQRALARFSTTPVPADGLVLCAQSLGEPAVQAFNTLTSDPFFSQVPAVLLVPSKHRELAEKAVTDERRRVLVTPFHTRDITELLDALIGTPA